MTIRTRLALGSFAIAAVLLVPLVMSLVSLQRLHTDVSRFHEREFAGVLLLGRVRGVIDDLGRTEQVLRQSDGAALQALLRDTASFPMDTLRLIAFADLLDAYALDSAANHLRSAAQSVAGLVTEVSAPDARAAAAEAATSIDLARRWLNVAERELADTASLVAERAAQESRRARGVAATSLAIAVALALGIGIWLTVSIGRPVAALERGMLAVADGKFEHELGVDPERRDEFGRLAQSYRVMAERLDHLEKLKAVWTSVATHELKTPINVIMGHVQLADEGIYGELTPKQRKMNDTLKRNAEVLKSRVQRLLDVSQFEAGAGKLEVADVGLDALLSGVEASFSAVASEKQVAFAVVRVGELPATVRWDRERIGEVLDNLLSNAFKFTPAGGRVELCATARDGRVQLEFRDSGAGIPAEQVPRLFEKFYQADNQRRASARGTGLGLAISKEIVEAHGGTVTCKSALGAGTTFTVSLPLDATPASSAPAPGAAPSPVSSSPSSTSSAPDRGSALRL